MAEPSEFGHVVDLTLGEPDGTALLSDAAVSATSLSVEYAGDFDPDGGTLVLNGELLGYDSITEGAVEGDPDVITLSAPLATAATADDRVGLVAGGEPVLLWQLHVDLGDGDPVDIDIPFEQRALWATVDPAYPVPVVLSADLTRLLEVPGRTPVLDASTIDSPSAGVYRLFDQFGIAASTWTRIIDWNTASDAARHIDVTPADGLLEVATTGRYLIVGNIAWSPNATGGRRARIILVEPDDTELVLRQTFASPEPGGASEFQVTTSRVLTAGQRIGFEVRHSATGIGTTLEALGDSNGTGTALEMTHIAQV